MAPHPQRAYKNRSKTNSAIAPTDVMVVASAMLDATGLNVFELGAWQSMSRVGRLAQT